MFNFWWDLVQEELQTKHNTAIICVPSGLTFGQQNDNTHATPKPSEITQHVLKKLHTQDFIVFLN